MVGLPNLPGLAGASAGGPIGLGVMSAGAIASGIGSYEQSQYAKQISQSSQNIAALHQQMNTVNWNQAKLGFERNRLQEFRNAQQSRAQAISASVGAGAQFSSSLSGGLANIMGEEGNTLLSLNQNKKLAGQAYTINQNISQNEQDISKAQGQAATWQGVSSLGQGAMSLGGNISNASTNPGGATIFG